MAEDDIEALAVALRGGSRRALARALTLVESTREDHRAAAAALLARLRGPAPALRLALSGPPGAGKSTLIETLGLKLTAAGLRVAVLAVDPSSQRTGGAILGDKTRMPKLSAEPQAFIRPSPSGGGLGGVARRTREALALTEAAGFDVAIVETVGVGQSETMAAEMTDVFALLVAPGGGDELQGVKRGVMEMADLVIVNKADGELAAAAARARGDYAGALRLMRPRPGDPEGWPRAMTVSAATGAGLDDVWTAIRALDDARRASGARDARRRAQAVSWFRHELDEGLRAALRADPALEEALPRLETEVAHGRRDPAEAARDALAPLLARLRGGDGAPDRG